MISDALNNPPLATPNATLARHSGSVLRFRNAGITSALEGTMGIRINHGKPVAHGKFAPGCDDCGLEQGHAVGCVWDDSGADVPLEDFEDLEGASFIAFAGQRLQEVRDAA